MASRGKALKRVLIAIVALVAVLVAAMIWYVNDYYRADDVALEVLADVGSDVDGVVVSELPDGSIAFIPADPKAGLVFYPGAKVQPEAYAPLLEQCAERGILCVLVKPLFNLAILSPDLADGALREFPDISTWIIAGHSMGGLAAADYTARHADDVDAVALLASYPAVDLTGFTGSSLSLIGTNDGVLNWDNYEAADSKLPSGSTKELIEGGNHAYFGNYGEQAGDGQAAISRDEQQRRSVEELAELAELAKAA